MRKQSHHMTETGSEDRIGNFTSNDRCDRPASQALCHAHNGRALTEDLAGEVIRLARLAAAMHMIESAHEVTVAAPAHHASGQEPRA